MGTEKVNYKLRDWLFSRQRYWGEPFPIIHWEDGEIETLPADQLPLLLPEIEKFQPSPEIEQAEDVIYKNDMTDISDILRDLLKGNKEN